MLNKYFDKIYLINLDRRPDRMMECSDFLETNNIVYERFSAVDGREINPIEYGISNERHNKSELGCLLSHLNIMKDIKRKGYKNILILEDDFEPCDDFNNVLAECMLQLPNDWQWLYFGGSHFEEPNKVSDNIYRVNKTLTTHAYAIKSEVVDDLIELLESNLIGSVDTVYSSIQKKLNTYVTIPHTIYQRDSYSDIQNKQVSYKGVKETIMNLGK